MVAFLFRVRSNFFKFDELSMRINSLHTSAFIFILLSLCSISQVNLESQDESYQLYDSWVHHNIDLNYDSSMYYGDEYVKYQIEYGNRGDIIDAYNHKIKSLRLFGKLNEGLKLAVSVFEEFCSVNDENSDCKDCNDIYRQLSDFMIILQDYRKGISYLEMCCKDDGGDPLDFYAKARVFCLLNLPDSAMLSTVRAIEVSRIKGDAIQIIGSYNKHGLIAKNLGRFNEGIDAFSKAIEIIDSVGLSQTEYSYILGNLGACYFATGELDLAYSYLLEDAKGSLESNYLDSYVSTQLLLGEIDFERKNYQGVVDRFTSLESGYKNRIESTQSELDLVQFLMKSYKLLGNGSMFNHYLDKWITLNSDFFRNQTEIQKDLINENAANGLRQYSKQMDIEQKLLQEQLLTQSQEEDKNRLKNWLLFSGLLIIILTILFLFWQARKRGTLKEAQLKLIRKEQQILELKIKEESSNVRSLSHELHVKQEFSSRLLEQLAQLETISKPDIKNIELFIRNELEIKSTRAGLEERMGELSSEFHMALKMDHPNLTDADVALASMIVMNMSNKEIGISKNMSVESIKTTKYRLKKKLGLDPSQEMNKYLSGFV